MAGQNDTILNKSRPLGQRPEPNLKLPDHVGAKILTKHYSQRTEEGYLHSILAPFPGPHIDNTTVEVKVLNLKPDTFHQAQAGPVEYPVHEKMDAFHVGHHALDLGLGHHDGRSNTSFPPDRFELILNRLVEYMAVQEHNDVHSLSLRGGRNHAVGGKVA